MHAGTPLAGDQERPAYDILLMDMRTKKVQGLTTDPLSE